MSGRRVAVYGLTGGIAAGKSAAARLFAQAGIPIVDADVIAHDLLAPGGSAHEAVRQRFGSTDRDQLRARVFGEGADATRDRQALEQILHPMIAAESTRQIEALAERGARVVIYDAALLVETGRYRELDGLIVIEAFRDLRKRRLMKRDRLGTAQAEAILDSQGSDELRRKAATVVIDNSGTEQEFAERIVALARELIEAHPS